MDNQYNYYRPDSDENRGAGNQQGFGAGPQKDPKTSKPKKGYMKKVALVVGAAVLFGAVGGVTMQGTSYLTGKLLGKNTKSTVGTTKTVSNAKLTTSTSTVTSDVSDIVENTLPSIVSITNMSVQEVQNFFGGISQQESESAGSGIIISQNDSELLVVTNNHVVEGSDTLTVTFNDGNSVEAQIKGTDSARDLAVVAVPLDKISDDTMNAIKVATLGDSDSLKVGEPAIAIGNALGYGQSVTNGIISALGRTVTVQDEQTGETVVNNNMIQTNAAINPGNSGGALLNASGEVVGINSAKYSDTSVEGFGYAIPMSDAMPIVEQLIEKGQVDQSKAAFLGIQGQDISSSVASAYNMPQGVYVYQVVSGSPAEKAGLRQGDIITEFDGQTITGMTQLKQLIASHKSGDEVKMTMERLGNGYKEKSITVTLAAQSDFVSESSSDNSNDSRNSQDSGNSGNSRNSENSDNSGNSGFFDGFGGSNN